MKIAYQEYIEYLKTLDLVSLKKEASYMFNYLDNLMGVYNGLINLIKHKIIADIKMNLVYYPSSITRNYLKEKLSDLKEYLIGDVYNFLNSANKDISKIEINSSVSNLSEKEVYENILLNYSLIYEKFDEVEGLNNIKYSWYDCLNNLYNILSSKIPIYFENLEKINEENKISYTNNILKDIIKVVEEYSDHYIYPFYRIQEILDEESYSTLLKYNCIESILELCHNSIYVGVDFVDLENILKNSSIARIFNDDKEIVLSSTKPNKFILVGLDDCITESDIRNKIEKYKKECDSVNCKYIYGDGINRNNTIVIYLLEK